MEEVAPRQGVSPAAEGVQPGAPGYEYSGSDSLRVVYALQERLPLSPLVDLVKDDEGARAIPCLLYEGPSILGRVEVQVVEIWPVLLKGARQGRLADLARARDEDHFVVKVRDDRVVLCSLHAAWMARGCILVKTKAN